MAIRKRLLILVIFAVAACSAPSPGTPTLRPATPSASPSASLAFDARADTLIIDVDSNHAGPPFPYELCSKVPNMRVWGDGRIVVANSEPGYRRVLTGHLTNDKMARLIGFLYDQLFSKAWTSEPPNPAAIYFGIKVHLRSATLNYSWGEQSEPPIYRQLLAQIEPHDLTPYVPQGARLRVAQGYVQYPAPSSDRPVWPAQFGLSLSQVPPAGALITGETLAHVWDALNHNVILNYKEGSNYYALWLELPEISIPDSRYACPGVL